MSLPVINLNGWKSLDLDQSLEEKQSIKYVRRLQTSIPYSQFFHKFLESNSPCLLQNTFTNDWKARAEWVNDNGSPNLEYLKETFGNKTDLIYIIFI